MTRQSLGCIKLAALIMVSGSVFAHLSAWTFAKTPKAAKPNGHTLTKPLPPEYSEAVKDLNAGKYRDALDKFQHLDGSGYCCDKVHYYIAQTYQGMNQTVPAEMNYEWVYYYRKNPTLRSYAQSAIQTLSYYQGHRTYRGQGNNFSRITASAGGGGRGGGLWGGGGGGGGFG